jgi:hypothetical protein
MAFSIEPAFITSHQLMKKISSAFSMVFSLWAIMTLVVLLGSLSSIICKSCSVTVSILAVASSNISNSGFLRTALINATSCLCHKLNVDPDDKISVSSHLSNLSRRILSHSDSINFSSSEMEYLEYSSFQYIIFSNRFHVNRNGSCNMNQILDVL